MRHRENKRTFVPFHVTHEKHSLFSRNWVNPLVLLGFFILMVVSMGGCMESRATGTPEKDPVLVSAKDILGNRNFPGICYGGYRDTARTIQPTLDEIKEDLKILSAIGIRIVRTYNTKFDFAHNVVKAIQQLRNEDPAFEMYVMLGAWIQCKDANTDHPDHTVQDTMENTAEIDRAIDIARKYPGIVKIIAVGNEAMVHWQTKYFVSPRVILHWVNHLQGLKEKGALPANLWITSSDNFASWGGGDDKYHNATLDSLIQAVDYVSMHTYPMHDTHYNPDFWGIHDKEKELPDSLKIKLSMQRAFDYALEQYDNTSSFIALIDPDKPVHIGETGWATRSSGLYGSSGSKATDEYKSGLYYAMITDWAHNNGITCFYFEAFDEIWKDRHNPKGSENHFGLFDINGRAKYAIWDHVDNGSLDGLHRGGHHIQKTFGGDRNALMREVELPPINSNLK